MQKVTEANSLMKEQGCFARRVPHPWYWGAITEWRMIYLQDGKQLETIEDYAHFYNWLMKFTNNSELGEKVNEAAFEIICRKGVQEKCLELGYLNWFD